MSKLTTEEVIKRAKEQVEGRLEARASMLLSRANVLCGEAAKLYKAADNDGLAILASAAGLSCLKGVSSSNTPKETSWRPVP